MSSLTESTSSEATAVLPAEKVATRVHKSATVPAHESGHSVDIYPDDATPLVGNVCVSFSAEQEHALRRRFDAAWHEDGMQARELANFTVAAIFAVGKIISRRYRSEGGRRGRNSQYGAWCKTYLDHLSQRTCDRWRRAYDCYAQSIDDPEYAAAFRNIQASALHVLCESRVPPRARERALEMAKYEEPITKEMAQVLISQCGGRKAKTSSSSSSPSTRKVECPIKGVGKVTVTHPDDVPADKAIDLGIAALQKKKRGKPSRRQKKSPASSVTGTP